MSNILLAQTTFTESTSVYGLNICNIEEYVWVDYDCISNTNKQGCLLRTDEDTFTDALNSNNTLSSVFFNDSLEHIILFVDFTKHGYPSIHRNKNSQSKVYLQNLVTNNLGDVTGRAISNQTFNNSDFTEGYHLDGIASLNNNLFWVENNPILSYKVKVDLYDEFINSPEITNNLFTDPDSKTNNRG